MQLGFALFLSFGLALALALVLIPKVKTFAISMGALDKPNARKVHKEPIPLWGGLGVYVAFTVSLWLSLWLWPDNVLSNKEFASVVVMTIGGLGILITGMIDDRFQTPAKIKLLAQIGVAVILLGGGIQIEFVAIPGYGLVYLGMLQSWFVTIFWIVGIMNAINLLDGLDGLVGGFALTSALLLAFVAGMQGHMMVVVAMMALAGAALGFLKYNFNPATIFMGDTGSLFVGLSFAGWSIVGFMKTTATITLLIPVLLILALPILDTSFAIVRRGLARQPIFKPDKGHIHHRLLGLGLSQRQAVMTIYLINLFFGLAGILFSYRNGWS